MTRIEDQAEIEELQAIFAHAADRGDYDLLRALYTDDATDDHGAYDGPVDGYLEWIRHEHEKYEILSHLYARPLVFVSGDRAESEIKGHVYLRTRGPQPISKFSVARTFDTYRRTAAGWRFTSRAVCFDWSGPTFEPATTAVPTRLQGRMDAQDPFYTQLPNLAAALRRIADGRP